jgi:prepilin-type N-terminal cleavage/methylation domain-containing protein
MHRRAFTLIELLVVIAVIAVISIIVVLILNPSELLKQSRDSNRVSDLSTLKTAISVYETQGGSGLGNASTSYISIFDPTATSSAGDQCQGLSLASLPAGWTYHCVSSSTLKNVDGTGWVPVNFSTGQLRSPISQLPIDPVNSASTGNYFTYTTSAGTYELTAPLESQKYASTTSIDGGLYSDLYETGSNLALAPTDYAGGTGAGHNGYSYARAITMSGSNVSGTLSSFPMLFSGTYSYLAASSSAGNVQSASGYDIAFTSDLGCTSKLSFEQESYTSSNGAIVDWINVPSITGGTVIYLCYGKSGITSSQQNVTGTWNANYKAVWHLSDNAATTTVNDSTANANTGAAAANTNGKTTTGEIGSGLSFNGSTDQIQITGSNSVGSDLTITSTITVEAWANNTSFPGNSSAEQIVGKSYTDPTEAYYLSYSTDGSFVKSMKWYSTNFPTTYGVSPVLSGAPSGWHDLVGTYDGTQWDLYWDGISTSTSVTAQGPFATAGYFDMGGSFNGSIDEVRVSNSARSSQWILTEYNNQSSPSTFYTLGSAM